MNLLERKREEHLCRALQRVGSVLVCISLLLALAFPPQPAKAIAVADDVAIAAIVAAFLASCGMTLHASGMDNGAIAQQVYNMTDEWVKANYGTPEEQQQVYEDLKDVGFKDGLILIGGTAAGALTNLAQWVKGKYRVNDTSSSNVFNFTGDRIVDIDGNEYFLWSLNGSGMTSDFSLGSLVFLNGMPTTTIRFSEEYWVTFFYGEEDDENRIFVQNASGRTYSLNTECKIGFRKRFDGLDDRIYVCFTYPTYNHSYAAEAPGFPVCKSSVCDLSSVNLSLDFDSSSAISIPTTIPDTQQLTISTGAASDLTLDQALEQILAAIAAGELSATKEIAEAGTATGEDVVPVDEAYPDVGELGLPALADTLTTRFPFSIPWDVAKAVRLLAAPAKTPRFEVDFFAPISDYVGGWQGSTKVVIDFSEVELLGQLTRWTSTIGFCLLLASGTKKLIWTA